MAHYAPATSSAPDMAPHGKHRVVGLSIVAALGGFLFGYDSAVINGTVDALREEYSLGQGMLGFAVASTLIGAMLGAWYAGRIADSMGRVRTMLVAALMFCAASVGAAFAFGIWDLIAWRIVGGIGVGMASVIAPAYIAEIAPAHIRGRLGSLQQLAIVTGIFAALLFDWYAAHAAGGAGNPSWLGLEAWRWMFLSMIVPSVIYGVLALTLPESPRYLVARHRDAEAAQVLGRVQGLSEPQQKQMIESIQATLRTDRRQTLKDLFVGGKLMPVVWVGILVSVFQQFVGINVIFYYSAMLWRSVGFTEENALQLTVLTSVVNIVVTIVAIMLVDKVGRKPLLLVGSAGMTVTLAIMAFCFSQATGSGDSLRLPDQLTTLALVAANLFVIFFGVSWGPVVWVLLGEMFPNQIRAVALSLAAAAQWLANFIITMTFPTLAAAGLELAYGLYAFFALLSCLFVWRMVKETKGKELEDM